MFNCLGSKIYEIRQKPTKRFIYHYIVTRIMARTQIRFDGEPVEKTRTFMRKLFALELEGRYVCFEKLPYGTMARVDDSDMDLETYLANMRSPFVNLNLGFEDIPGKVTIAYFVRGVKLPNSPDERFAYWSAPDNSENYRQVALLFQELYDKPIQ